MRENIKVVSVLLGHSTTAMTLETYTTVLESLKEKANRWIDELYTNSSSANISVKNSVKILKLVK
jgi:integrase